MTEIKDIPNYEGLYQASSDGRIFSVKTNKELIQFNHTSSRNVTMKCVELFNSHGSKVYHVSTLIGRTFVNSRDNIGFIHKDGNKNNNCVDNLVENCQCKRAVKLIFDTYEIAFDSFQKASVYLGHSKSYLNTYLRKHNNRRDLVIYKKHICKMEFN